MDSKNSLSSQATDIALSATSALAGFAIGGPVGAVVGGAMTPAVKLTHQLIHLWLERRRKRIANVVEEAFINSGKKEENILQELVDNPEWADSFMSMILQLVDSDPELDGLFSHIMSSAIKTDDKNERNRLILLNSSLKGLNIVQVQILRCLYEEKCTLSAVDISKKVKMPEIELRNAVRDLELRGMIIDNGAEPTVWRLRELGLSVAKAIDVLEA